MKKHLKILINLFLTVILASMLFHPNLTQAANPPIFTVNSLGDVPAGGDLTNGICQTASDNSTCTLRAAIMKANHYPGGGITILIPDLGSPYQINIAPVSPNDDETNGDLNITQTVSLQGSSPLTTIIQGNSIDRIFRIAKGATATISGLTLTGGADQLSPLDGGAIYNQGMLNLSNTILSHNQTQADGGAVWSNGTAALSSVVVDGNQAQTNGGGIANYGTMTLQKSTVSHNEVGGSGVGGGVMTIGPMLISQSTISGNLTYSRMGGGIYDQDTLQVINSTISNNSTAVYGGGIYNNGTATIAFSTIAGNLSNSSGSPNGYSGGGIYNAQTRTLNLRASLLAWNFESSTYNDCMGDPINSEDYNYLQTYSAYKGVGECVLNGATGHNLVGNDPGLDELRYNGKTVVNSIVPPRTRALLPGSPSLGAVPASQCIDLQGSPLLVDERDYPRPTGAACDIGAFEGARNSSLLRTNLIKNGDSEMTAGSPFGAGSGLPYWIVSSASPLYTAAYYGYSPVKLGFPLPSSPGPADRGDSFFLAWNSNSAQAYQMIDVSSLAASIDAGHITYQLSGYFGGIGNQEDTASAYAVFHDAALNATSSPTIGNYGAASRSNTTELLPGAYQGVLPAGTRSIEVDMYFLEGVGSTHNGAAVDDLSLVLVDNTQNLVYLPLVTNLH